MSINLMPWRQERRKRQQKDFLTKIGLSAISALGVVVVGAILLSTVISGQEKRNQFLDGQIKEAQVKIKEIDTLQKRRDQMLGRKQVIEKLQADRDLLPNVLYQVAINSVEGIVITGYEHKNNVLEIKGRSTSNSSVAAFIRNIEQSKWFDKPEIIIIENQLETQKPAAGQSDNPALKQYGYDFVVKTGIKNPNAPVVEEDSEQAPKSGARDRARGTAK